MSTQLTKHVYPLLILATVGLSAKYYETLAGKRHAENLALVEQLEQIQQTQLGQATANAAVTASERYREALQHEYQKKVQQVHELQGMCLDAPIDFSIGGLFFDAPTGTGNGSEDTTGARIPLRQQPAPTGRR